MKKRKRKEVLNENEVNVELKYPNLANELQKVKNRKARSIRGNDTGITLVALVVSIVVMLVLAGTSLNATIGENGIITQATNAKAAQELAETKEQLEYLFADYNIDSEIDINRYLISKKGSEIDDYQVFNTADGPVYIVTKDGKQFAVVEKGGYYYAEYIGDKDLGNLGAGVAVVTQDAFDESTGNMSFEMEEGESASLFFAEKIE